MGWHDPAGGRRHGGGSRGNRGARGPRHRRARPLRRGHIVARAARCRLREFDEGDRSSRATHRQLRFPHAPPHLARGGLLSHACRRRGCAQAPGHLASGGELARRAHRSSKTRYAALAMARTGKAGALSETASLSVDWLTSPPQVDAIEAEWRALENAVHDRTHLSTFDFLSSWYRHYAGEYGGE